MTGKRLVRLEEQVAALRAAMLANDRRYAEVAAEREKALKIKETADLTALQLAREIQTYKDEKANELREQINSERGLYATNEKLEATIKPLAEFVAQQHGGDSKSTDLRTLAFALVMAAVAIASLVFAVTR